MSKVSEKHPSFVLRIPQWTKMRHFYEGEDLVKEQGTEYLPATASMIIDGMGPNESGFKKYERYKARAVFPEYIEEAVDNFVGMMHEKPANIELPASMEYLRDDASPYGESLQDLLRSINFEQILTGRLGLLADFESGSEMKANIHIYIAESIINWDKNESDDNVNLVVLDESGQVREDFTWSYKESYRVLELKALEGDSQQFYYTGLFEGSNPQYSEIEIEKVLLRDQPLEYIPFFFINTIDVVPEVSKVPLNALGNLCLAIYRGEADYRQTLFMQGQDTLVIIGEEEKEENKATRVGADAIIRVDTGGDAKYVGISSNGLPHQESSLNNDRKRAESMAATVIAPYSNQQESGVALTTRIAAQTASLNQIALAGAKGLEQALKSIAEWSGADPEKVSVEPNLDFSAEKMAGKDLKEFVISKASGAPISKRTIHDLMVKRGVSSLSYEEEMALIDEEFGDSGLDNDDGE